MEHTKQTQSVRTVGDLIALVDARITAAHREHCPSLPAFLSLRKLARAAAADDSLRMRPRDAVTAVLSRAERRSLWKLLAEIMGTSPRGLRRPRLLRQLLIGTSIGVLLFAVFSAIVVNYKTLPLTLAIAVFAIICLHFVTVGFRWDPPTDWTTFGEITTRIVGCRVATRMLHLQSRDEILSELRPLLIDVLRVDANDIVPSARFIEDLGMD